jgi:hypothetical protein
MPKILKINKIINIFIIIRAHKYTIENLEIQIYMKLDDKISSIGNFY